MKYVLVITWFLLLTLLMSRWKFFRNSGIPMLWLAVLFGVKIIAGLVYGKLFLMYYGGGDPYKVFKAGSVLYNSIHEDPAIYFRLVFGPNGGFAELPVYKYAFQSSYWDHAGFYNIARLHALFRPVSMGYYSVHITFMAFLMMIGSVHFYRLLKEIRGFMHWPVLVVVFLMPSLIFWTGGFHKDGFVYLGIGILLYHTWWFVKKMQFRHLFFIMTGLAIIAMVRPFQLALVLPPLLLIMLTQKWPGKPFWKFGLAYFALATIALIVDMALPGINIFEILANKQHAFLVESGSSEFMVNSLNANFSSFAAFFPTAFVNAFFRPFPWDEGGMMQLFSIGGVIGLWAFAVFSFYFRRRNFTWDPVMVFLVFYSISNIILIGYLVSNSGTLVRYRAVSINFLLMVMVLITDWPRVLKK